jgi:hypothetical protein
MVSQPVCLGVEPHLGPKARFLLLSDSCGFVAGSRTLTRGWVSNLDVLLVLVTTVVLGTNSWLYFTLKLETPQPGGPGPIFLPRKLGSLVIPPGIGFFFHQLL